MKVKIQACWAGGDKFYWRALLCGGLRIIPEIPGRWTRRDATRMLDLLAVEVPAVPRSRIRFVHV